MADSKRKAPKLRFPGFNDDWEQRKLGDYVVDYVEKTTIQNQFPVLTSSQKQGIVLQEKYFSNRQVTTDDNVGYYILPRGYFTYRSRSDNDLFAFNRNDVIDKGIISYFYPVFTLKNANSDFFLRRINNGIQRQLSIQAEGTGQHVLSLKKFKNIEAPFPDVEEQEKIGGFFEQMDNLITLHQRKLSDVQKLKSGLLQKMFPKNGEKVPEIRFPEFSDDWEQRKLGEVVSRQIKGKAQFEKLSIGDVQYLDTSRLNGGQPIMTDGIQDVNSDDILILWDGSKAGTVYTGFEGALGSTLKAYRTSANSQFVYQFLKYKQENIYNNYRTPNIPHVQKDFLEVFKIIVPSIKEQERIGLFFKQFDDLITLHQRKLEHLQQQKKALLQQMFI